MDDKNLDRNEKPETPDKTDEKRYTIENRDRMVIIGMLEDQLRFTLQELQRLDVNRQVIIEQLVKLGMEVK